MAVSVSLAEGAADRQLSRMCEHQLDEAAVAAAAAAATKLILGGGRERRRGQRGTAPHPPLRPGALKPTRASALIGCYLCFAKVQLKN